MLILVAVNEARKRRATKAAASAAMGSWTAATGAGLQPANLLMARAWRRNQRAFRYEGPSRRDPRNVRRSVGLRAASCEDHVENNDTDQVGGKKETYESRKREEAFHTSRSEDVVREYNWPRKEG